MEERCVLYYTVFLFGAILKNTQAKQKHNNKHLEKNIRPKMSTAVISGTSIHLQIIWQDKTYTELSQTKVRALDVDCSSLVFVVSQSIFGLHCHHNKTVH